MLKSNKTKRGFTLAELMVCLALMAIIATILMPAIERLKPNKKKVMFKKAYYLTERIVSELINDEDLYPFVEGKVGFDNTVEVEVNDHKYKDNSKFCELFASKLNTISGSANCTMPEDSEGEGTPVQGVSFTTTDAIEWTIPLTDFADKDTYYSIKIDVNGSNGTSGAPNCLDGADGCTDPDIFVLKVRSDGKMLVDGPKAMEYVGSLNIIENQKTRGN